MQTPNARLPQKLTLALCKAAPSVSVTVRWEEDPAYTWDGDGPDPAESGEIAHDVQVEAATIVNGSIYTANMGLGGCYAKPDEFDPEIHGYAWDLAREALDALKAKIPLGNRPRLRELAAAILAAREDRDAQAR